MKNKTFTLRIDLESDKGIKAVPKLLDLLKKHKIKASFYLVMSGESNFIELLKYRGKMRSAGERKIKIWTLKEKLRMALLPKNFVRSNKKILKRVLDEGHELGIHGWKHRAWTRGFDKINTKKHINKAIKKYKKFFGMTPVSWSSPGFNINERVLKNLEEAGIKFISDFPGEQVKKYGAIKNIPLTIKGKNNMPFVEYWAGKGKTNQEILKIFKKEIKNKKIVSFYIHGLYEVRFKLNLLEEIFKFVKENKIKNKRIMDY
jgi:peptidoglycan/xylan/chitin deacetylase (PgdA/CDA1 family)